MRTVKQFSSNQRELIRKLGNGPTFDVDLRSVTALVEAGLALEGRRGFRLSKRGHRVRRDLDRKLETRARFCVRVDAGCDV